MIARLRALCDLQVADVRESSGRHEYDGVIQDLSPSGVAQGLARLGHGPPEGDPQDEAHLCAFEAGMRTLFGTIEEHRRNPLVHWANLDVSCYEREYAPADERAEARRRHLRAWPDAVDAAVASLDRVPAAVAGAVLPGIRGLADGVEDATALAAHARLVAHVERFSAEGDPDAALGAGPLAKLMGDGEAMSVDLNRLADRADRERDRLVALLRDACSQLGDGAAPAELLPRLLADHPTDPEEICAQARVQIEEATAFALAHDLLPDLGGECRVGPAPPSRRIAMAMMSWSAPWEPDAPSWYYVTPPDPSWPREEQEEWLSVFSPTTLPAITVHEVTPGHYAHGRLLRRLDSDVRRTLLSWSFVEGWAHYGEELYVEEGFRDADPGYTIGVCVEALLRVTRLAVAIGLHSGAMTLDEAAHRFEADAFQRGAAARSEAGRAAWDPTYGRYTLGKLEIQALRGEAMTAWGSGYSHRRFHEALLGLGAPPLGLMRTALHS